MKKIDKAYVRDSMGINQMYKLLRDKKRLQDVGHEEGPFQKIGEDTNFKARFLVFHHSDRLVGQLQLRDGLQEHRPKNPSRYAPPWYV